jgi:hypothetical protein
MITETTHPGACTVSEAVLCAGDRAPLVIAWAFEVQDEIRAAAKTDPAAAARYVKQKFPDLAACVGSPDARSRLNKSLRWSVANNIHVLTPQLFVNNVKLCDEDVDLGLEYALSIMLDRYGKGTLIAPNAGSGAGSAAPMQHVDTPKPPDTDKPPVKTGDTPKGSDAAKSSDVPKGSDAAKGSDSAAPSDKPVTKPAETETKPADKPVDKPADKPADKPVDKPAETGSAGGAP